MAPPAAGDGAPLPPEFFARDPARVARELLGSLLVRRIEGERLVARVVETEAYLGADDRASHAWSGRRTPRNASLYLPPGHAYVYFIYGMHFCLNVVANTDGAGGAVLFRAAELLEGREVVTARRGLVGRPIRPGDLLGGPGRLCRGLGIDRGWDGVRLGGAEIALVAGAGPAGAEIVAGPRVGIAYAGAAAQWPLRFSWRGHPEVSRPRPR